MKTQTTPTAKKKYFNFYEKTILESICFDGYDVTIRPKHKNRYFAKIKETYKIFIAEYGYPSNIVRYGTKQNLFAEYLKGLPSVCSVPYMNYEILKNAQKDGFNLMTEQAEDNFLSMYWVNLGISFFELKENL